jgi:oligoribonuclease
MTGLNPETDCILSLSCLLTTSTLTSLDPHGFDAIIKTPASRLNAMDEWCTATHTQSGLISSCLNSTTTALSAANQLLAYIKSHIPEPGLALLAGSSIHADRAFLSKEPWDRVLGHLHYRLLDVSSIKEGVRRWAPECVLEGAPRKELRHEARADIEESIKEAGYYMGLLRGLGAVNALRDNASIEHGKEGEADEMAGA